MARARNRALMPSDRATFWRMMRRACWLRLTAKGSLLRSSAISATSAVSRAASVPAAPIAMPTVARARAGASLTPSPTMATASYRASIDSMAVTFCSGISSARISSTPTAAAMARAVASLSPVSMTVCVMPTSSNVDSTCSTPGRTVSATAINPRTPQQSSRTIMTVWPAACAAWTASQSGLSTRSGSLSWM